MLSEDLPPCALCAANEHKAGGFNMGGALNCQWFTCSGCEATIMVLDHRGGALLAFLSSAAMVEHAGSKHLPPVFSQWVNKTLIPTWRHRDELKEKFKDDEWRQWLKEVFWERFPGETVRRAVEPAPENTPENQLWKYRQPRDWPWSEGTISYHDCTDEARLLVDTVFGSNREFYGTYLPIPRELRESVYPPQIPTLNGIICSFWYVNPPLPPPFGYAPRASGFWVKVVPELSQKRVAPEDPLLRRNRELFDRVWAALAVALEQPFPPVEHTKNEYGGIEPWFKFQLANVSFIVGWRKRVINIQVDAPNPLPTADIYPLAQADKTTYSSEGGWQDPSAYSRSINIHAWGEAKCIEYLAVLCRAAILSRSTPC